MKEDFPGEDILTTKIEIYTNEEVESCHPAFKLIINDQQSCLTDQKLLSHVSYGPWKFSQVGQKQ